MGAQSLQEYADVYGDTICRTIDFQQLAQQLQRPVKVIIDGEGCLAGLVGGFLSDDTCGGQWFRAFESIIRLMESFAKNRPFPVQVVVAFDGQIGDKRLMDWKRSQLDDRTKIEWTLQHVAKRATPPPKIWAFPPAGARLCLMQALHCVGVHIFVSGEDYCRELADFWKHRGVDVLIGYNGEFFAWNPPRYVCGRNMRVHRVKGCVVSKEYLTRELCTKLGLAEAQLPLLVSLFGSPLLDQEQLADFYHRVLSAQGQNCVKGKPGKVDNAVANGRPTPKLSRFTEALVPAVAKFVASSAGKDLKVVVGEIFGSMDDPRAGALVNAVHYYKSQGQQWKTTKKSKKEAKLNNAFDGYGEESKANLLVVAPFGLRDLQPKLPKEPGPAKVPPIHSDVMAKAIELHSRGFISHYVLQVLSKGEVRIPVVFENAAHSNLPNVGLLFRDLRRRVYAVLFNYHHHDYTSKHWKEKQGKTPDDGKEEGSKTTGESESPYVIPEMKVREWVWSAVNPYETAEVVEPKSLGWVVPTVRRLWLGTNPSDTEVRMEAFMACMRSEALELLVPGSRAAFALSRPMFVLACVLRYMLTACPAPLLSVFEVKAVLATALSDRLGAVHFLRMLDSPQITVRSTEVAAAINFGLEMAFFANSACGAPIPANEICPWHVFDGKLFQRKLDLAQQGATIFELCDGNPGTVNGVDAVLQELARGINWGANGMAANLSFPPGGLPMGFTGPNMGPPMQLRPPMMMPLAFPFPAVAPGGPSVLPPAFPFQPGGFPPFGFAPGAPVGGTLQHQQQQAVNRRKLPIPTRGGQLEVGGIVVGQWDGNHPSANGHGLHGRLGKGPWNQGQQPQGPSVGGRLFKGRANKGKKVQNALPRKKEHEEEKKKAEDGVNGAAAEKRELPRGMIKVCISESASKREEQEEEEEEEEEEAAGKKEDLDVHVNGEADPTAINGD